MDFIMPGMDGLETTRCIRAMALASQPRIVALTANAFAEDRERASAAGMDAFLSKPLQLKQLRHELCTACLKKHTPSKVVDR
ncbi:MAG: hypothetical protein C1943_04555 [Halochromatium sp.]|nr:hypothetical protein [Halochromatium sp.]